MSFGVFVHKFDTKSKLYDGVVSSEDNRLTSRTYVKNTMTGIVDDSLVQIDGSGVAANDFARFTANGVEGRSYAEVLADLSGQAAAAFSLNSQKITNLAVPTAAADAATKGYVDAAIEGLDIKDSARVASTGNIAGTYSSSDKTLTLSTEAAVSIDGVSLAVGERVLVKDQSTQSQNGIYSLTTQGAAGSGTDDQSISGATWYEDSSFSNQAEPSSVQMGQVQYYTGSDFSTQVSSQVNHSPSSWTFYSDSGFSSAQTSGSTRYAQITFSSSDYGNLPTDRSTINVIGANSNNRYITGATLSFDDTNYRVSITLADSSESTELFTATSSSSGFYRPNLVVAQATRHIRGTVPFSTYSTTASELAAASFRNGAQTIAVDSASIQSNYYALLTLESDFIVIGNSNFLDFGTQTHEFVEVEFASSVSLNDLPDNSTMAGGRFKIDSAEHEISTAVRVSSQFGSPDIRKYKLTLDSQVNVPSSSVTYAWYNPNGGGTNGVLTRAIDFDASSEITAGAFCFVAEGSTHADAGFIVTTNDDITLDGTGISFTQFSGAGQITAGAGITKTGNELSIASGAITNAMLAGSIANAKLANDSVSFGGISLDLGGSDATPAFDLTDATNYPTSSLTGTITNAQLAGSIANAKLANSSVSLGGISIALGGTDATPAFDLADAINYPTSSLDGTITNAQLAGSIANAKLANSSVSLGGISIALGGTDATPAFDLADAINYPTSSLDGTITNAQLAGSITNAKLSNSSVSLGGVSVALGASDATPAFDLADATGLPISSGVAGLGSGVASALAGALDTDLSAVSGSDDSVASAKAIKAYVDSVAQGLSVKDSVRVATTEAITIATALNSGDSIDGVTLANGDRVLVKDQTTASQNGIYVVAASPARSDDFDATADVSEGAFFFVEEGSTNADNGFVMTSQDVTVDSDSIAFVQFSGAGQITAGAGLTKVANALSISSGAITNAMLAGSISNDKLAGSIANAKLANDSVSFGGISLDLGGSDATPAFDLTDATNYPTSSLTGTITNAQLAGSIANAKLANDSVSFGGISLDLGGSDATPAFDLTDATNYPTSSLTGTITNAQLAGSIANDKLAGSIAASKLADAQLQDVAGLAVTNGNFIVGDGSNFVAESGATARASLALGSAAGEALQATVETTPSALPSTVATLKGVYAYDLTSLGAEQALTLPASYAAGDVGAMVRFKLNSEAIGSGASVKIQAGVVNGKKMLIDGDEHITLDQPYQSVTLCLTKVMSSSSPSANELCWSIL